MPIVARTVGWLFSRPAFSLSPWQIIAWWEARRIPFNAFILVYGMICMEIYDWGISASGLIPPGESAIPAAFYFVAPIGVNFCYTLGWMVELIARRLRPSLPTRAGPLLLIMGIGLSLLVVGGPAAVWGGWRLLTFIGIRLPVT